MSRIPNDHIIWIKQRNNNGQIYYSEMLCYNPDFYMRLMEIEFNIHQKMEGVNYAN